MDGKPQKVNSSDKQKVMDSKKSTEAGDIFSKTSKQRPPSPAPYAFHELEGEKSAKRQSQVKTPISVNSQSANLRAPYAQPVLDASKLHGSKKMTTVDERIASVRERRLQQQQAHDDSVNARLAKEEASRSKWEHSQEEKKKKIEEQREKDAQRRKEVEERKNKQDLEDKKRAEAIVARTEEQAKVVLRQKRAGSADRTKRWSWGAGGMTGGGGFSASPSTATRVDTAPSPFHYFDPTRTTKRTTSTDRQKRRPLSMNIGQHDLSSIHGDDGDTAASSPAAGTIFGPSKGLGVDDKFSKSPLVMNTTHMKFASGLRSYDSTPLSATSRKPVSPATTPRSRRARSSDTRTRTSISSETSGTKSVTRGRSTDVRKSPNSKNKVSSVTSPQQLTEPVAVSPRLLAPTRASMARSINHDLDELSTTSSNASPNVPLRSRSSDRKRPSSVKSDSSSASSTISSTQARNTAKSSTTRGTSPSTSSRPKQRPPSPIVRSTTPTNEKRGESPKSRSPVVKEAPKFPKRGPSPGRVKSSPTLNKKTPNRDSPNIGKPAPPQIKQSLTPTASVSRPKHSPASTPTSNLSKKVQKKMQKTEKTSAKKAETTKKPDVTTVGPTAESQSTNELDQTYLVISSPANNTDVPQEGQKKESKTSTELTRAQEIRQPEEKIAQDANRVTDAEQPPETETNKTIFTEETNLNQPSLADEIEASEQIEDGSAPEPSTTQENPAELPPPLSETDIIDQAAAKLSVHAITAAQNEFQNDIVSETGVVDEKPEPEVEEEPTAIEFNQSVADETSVTEEVTANQKSPQPDQRVDLESEDAVEEAPVVQQHTDVEPVVPPKDIGNKEEEITAAKPAPPVEEQKKKEKKVSPEEQAYKDAIAAKRREMKEKREREEKEKQERLKMEAEQQARREEDARRMAEEARLEHERMLEEERLKKEEAERKKKQEAEEMARKHEEFLKEQRERAEQRAREEAEKTRRDKELATQKKEEERLARKKRLEMIMRRTRGGDSPTSNATATTGDQSPANSTPVRGNSPPTLLTSDRVNSTVNSEKPNEIVNNSASSMFSEPKAAIIEPDAKIETITLEHSNTQYNGGEHPAPMVAFSDPLSSNEKLFSGSNFSPLGDATAQTFYNSLNGSNQENQDKLFEKDSENLFNNATTTISEENVPSGNLLDF